GGGHAGVEAAWALGKLGHTVALVTFDAGGLARMSCNPAIGGLAKGQLAREIDALGGLMGRLIDRTGIHFRMLNRRKGPAVQAPRAQADKPGYSAEAARILNALPKVRLIEGEVTEILYETAPGSRRRVAGVRIASPDWSLVEAGGAHSRGPEFPCAVGPRAAKARTPVELAARFVVLTTGTFLRARLFTGMDPRPGGRRGEPPSLALSACLQDLGLKLGRLKTGTPPRLRRDSIDFSHLEAQPGDEPPQRFSFFENVEIANRAQCHLTRTNRATHEVIRRALDRSPLYGGIIEGIGPRYCPSIEDKVVRFPERDSHHVFLEPEGLGEGEIYPNGISTSLPPDVQAAYVRTIRGLERAEIVHPGYAVEYDFLNTSQIDSTLKVRGIEGLYTAGQINGTSGYEEAAAQGIVAGLNVCAEIEGRPPFVLRRDDAYIGVLVDDLITKVPSEPYRMFTSQSEYRLLLRQDNADRRLSRIGWERGLLAGEDWEKVAHRWDGIARERARLGALRMTRSGSETIPEGDIGKSLAEVLKRPGFSLAALRDFGFHCEIPQEDHASLEADIKYEGYIARLMKEISRRQSIEELLIPEDLLDDPPAALSREARERLEGHRPRTMGQASRIPGVTPCDISLLLVKIHAAGGRKASGGRPADGSGGGYDERNHLGGL
ncbi:MAG: tRNA uridine-5-carboxymethylaminomethyl(34) synthesis enzyme MnmG, partial [Candidatus Eisenbacteria bacterium]